MVIPPEKCPGCGADNMSSISYCSVCGMNFSMGTQKASTGRKLDRKKMSKEQKIKIKKLKKKKELTEKYKNKKITSQQYISGLKKLGYGADVEKAMAFKNYIKQQIQAFENMEVAPEGMEGQYKYDPNESKAKLPTDDQGNVITDFSVAPSPAQATKSAQTAVAQEHVHSSSMDLNDRRPGSGPLFGDSLFSSTQSTGSRKKLEREIPKAELVSKKEKRKGIGSGRRRLDDLEWDEDEEEIEFQEEEEDFVIDLEEGEGESGWWDDEEWELDWSDEDEEEWEDWDLEEDEWDEIWDEDEEDDDEFVIEDEDDDLEEEDEDPWDMEDDDEDEIEFEEEEELDEFEEEEDDLEDDDEDDDWGEPLSRRKRRRNV